MDNADDISLFLLGGVGLIVAAVAIGLPRMFTNTQALWDTDASVKYDYSLSYYSEWQWVMLCNTPQLGVTMFYHLYNRVFTNMLLCAEYSSYGADRKSLRVTWPVKGSQQRSSYWLSIPYRYEISAMVFSAVLHWLISQGWFYALVIPYDVHGYLMFEKKSQVGTLAGLPLICSGVIMFILVALLLGLPFKKLKSSVPLAGPCSAAISAACHPTGEVCRATAAHGKVMWGEIDMPTGWDVDEDDGTQKAERAL
ncbi:hypothetical protein PHISCL_06249 [Aspergillus sclerotialis]|uniref:Uncharacterized protein n=1 Tax=Aspergillus sclerotialis TaxID=2070753 RepID=A0A3A2ZE41_9EURO|nr:hypothetical protein PHISCL_06249 [Aspergillus sclerotialis]